MKKLFLTALAVASLSNAATAADLNPAPASTIGIWEGWYAGINGGYGFVDEFDVNVDILTDVELLKLFQQEGLWPRQLDPDASGFFGGGQVGYNWQDGEWVYGLEGDFQFSDIDGRDGTAFFEREEITDQRVSGIREETYNSIAKQELSWFSTVRARAGVAPYEDLLFYATGGLAIGRLKHRSNLYNFFRVDDSDRSLVIEDEIEFSAGRSNTKFGWSAGFGGELKISEKVSIKGEYLYLDLGTTTLSGNVLETGFIQLDGEIVNSREGEKLGDARFKFKNRFHTVKVGVNMGF